MKMNAPIDFKCVSVTHTKPNSLQTPGHHHFASNPFNTVASVKGTVPEISKSRSIEPRERPFGVRIRAIPSPASLEASPAIRNDS